MSERRKNRIDLFSRVLILLAVVVAMAIINPKSFFSASNLSQVIFQQGPYLILLSFGMSLAIITKGIDVSMASVMVLSAYLSANAFKNGNGFLGLLISLGIGLAFGLANGLMITKVGIAPFIATYSVDFIAAGLAYVICNGAYIYGFPSSFRALTAGTLIPGLPNVALIAIVIFIVLYLLTKKTNYGRGFYSAGFNIDAAKMAGIKTDMTICSVYVINGLLAAITGILYLSRLNAADPNIGSGMTMDTMAATLIGGIPFSGGKGSLVNTIIGALIILFIKNGMNIMNISTNWQSAVVGMIIMASVLYEALIAKVINKVAARQAA